MPNPFTNNHKQPQLTINQIIIITLVLLLNGSTINTINHHSNHHHALDHFNNAIYHQLLAVEPKSMSTSDTSKTNTKQSSIDSKAKSNGLLEKYTNQRSFNNQNDEMKSKRSHKSSAIDSSIINDSLSSNKNSKDIFYSILHKESHPIIDYPLNLPSNQLSSTNQSNQSNAFSFSILNSTSKDDQLHNANQSTGSSEKLSKKASTINETSLINQNETTTDHLLTRSLFNQTNDQLKQRSTRSSDETKKELVRRTLCETNKDCPLSNFCDLTQNLCKCPKDYINIKDFQGQNIQISGWPPTHCYAATPLEKPCIYDEQCIVKHSKCTRDESLGQKLYCACSFGYHGKGMFESVFLIKSSFNLLKFFMNRENDDDSTKKVKLCQVNGSFLDGIALADVLKSLCFFYVNFLILNILKELKSDVSNIKTMTIRSVFFLIVDFRYQIKK